MNYKLLMNWDISPGKDQEYFEFIVREWGPGITKLGIELSGLWYTAYSAEDDHLQIMAEATAEDVETIRSVLKSPEWNDLHEKLLDCVTNYTQKIVRVTGEFQF